MTQGIKIQTYEGNSVRHTFLLKQFGKNAPVDVSGASAIDFEYESPDGVDQTPLSVSPSEPGADWATGVVVVLITTPLTDAVGDYPFSLTVTDGGEVITYAAGDVIVDNRRGYTTP